MSITNSEYERIKDLILEESIRTGALPTPRDVARAMAKIRTDPGIKATNPKDVAGTARIDMSLVPVIAIAEEALAFEEGATKYGAYNYTAVGVKSRVYIGAALRHLFKWLLGEERDPKTGVHHLGSVRACMGILLDAQSRGKLNDDRPPSLRDASARLDGLEARVSHVREVFSGYYPRHYTIEDSQNVKGTGEQIHRAGAQEAGQKCTSREDAQPLQGRDGGRMVQR